MNNDVADRAEECIKYFNSADEDYVSRSVTYSPLTGECVQEFFDLKLKVS